LVKLQIRVAAGEPLPLAQENIDLRGHAIECRIYAEDPDNNFFPSPGTILARNVPSGPGIRLDDGVYAGWTVPTDYDPMLGKLIVWGNDRNEAMARMGRALDEYYVGGIKTNVGLFRRILAEPEFVRGEIHTKWLDEFLLRTAAPISAASPQKSKRDSLAEDAAVLAAGMWHMNHSAATNPARPAPNDSASRWKSEGRREQLANEPRHK
jgi:acetyl-CoA carboxylase biotin carboxylase subunit